ncbi:MAG: class SAM-dependent methyltransferase [Paenibacillus sp.]|nr:class SAM-dependent methyltransferase [Paenibacillus sp.]
MNKPRISIRRHFEDWQPEAENGFDQVFAATAWNWVDPEVRYMKAWEILQRHFDWERIYHVDEYIKLLETFSGHILMKEWKREKLFNEIRVRLNSRQEKSVRRHWGAVLHVARRKN